MFVLSFFERHDDYTLATNLLIYGFFVQEKLDEIKQDPKFSTTTNVFEDALTALLGPEKRGAVRGLGRGVNATKLDVISIRDDNMTRLEDQCIKIQEEMKQLKEQVTLLMKNQATF